MTQVKVKPTNKENQIFHHRAIKLKSLAYNLATEKLSHTGDYACPSREDVSEFSKLNSIINSLNSEWLSSCDVRRDVCSYLNSICLDTKNGVEIKKIPKHVIDQHVFASTYLAKDLKDKTMNWGQPNGH